MRSRMHLRERPISSARIYAGRVVNLRVDTVKIPRGRATVREVVEHRGAAAIIPLIDKDEILLIRQFRYAVGEELLEIPAGTLDPGETPEHCAGRELVEEVGYSARKFRKLLSLYLAPGYSSEMIHIFLARDLRRTRAKPAEDETIRVRRISLKEALKLVRKGKIRDAKTICALLYLRLVMGEPAHTPFRILDQNCRRSSS